jgi:hypothetical protein
MWRRVDRARTDVSEEYIGSIVRVERITELRTLAVTSLLILFILMMEAICSSEMSVLTRAT